jgi:hypothetical protein
MNKPIFLIKTEGEWDAIEDSIRNMGRRNFNNFVRTEVNKLAKAYEKCPECITKASGKQLIKRPKIPMESFEKIEMIARKMNVAPSTVIDILIIHPLLQEKASVH